MEVSSPASRPSPAGGLRPALTPAAGTTPRLLPGAAANNFTTRSLQLKSPRIQGRPASVISPTAVVNRHSRATHHHLHTTHTSCASGRKGWASRFASRSRGCSRSPYPTRSHGAGPRAVTGGAAPNRPSPLCTRCSALESAKPERHGRPAGSRAHFLKLNATGYFSVEHRVTV